MKAKWILMLQIVVHVFLYSYHVTGNR